MTTLNATADTRASPGSEHPIAATGRVFACHASPDLALQDLAPGPVQEHAGQAAELEYPVRIDRYELIPDTGGAGKHRGALGLRRDIRVLIDDVTWARYGDRQRFAPFGLFGGKEGGKGQFVLNPETPEERVAKSKGLDRLKAGDLVSLRLPGTGGYGDPKERDRELLLRDVRDGKVSRESALRDYGVEITDEMLAEKK